MNFLSAVKAMERGKKVRRRIYLKGNYMVFYGIHDHIRFFDDNGKLTKEKCTLFLDKNDVLANDWEILKDKNICPKCKQEIN